MSKQLIVFIRTCLLVLALLPLRSFADDFPPVPSPPRLVNDLAHLMSPDEVDLLEKKLKAFSDSTSNQVSIVTVTSIGSYEIADYATKLGNRWGIGRQQRNNGVIILVAKDEHRVNISPGRGLEGALPDITAARIINDEIRPAFRDNKYYLGLDRATSAIIAATRGEYKADPRDSDSGGAGIGAGLVVLIIVIVLILFIRRGGGGGGGRYMSRGGAGDFGSGFILGNILGGGFGGGGFGGGGNSGGGDSGFGGFGGGSFGGGGASGSW